MEETIKMKSLTIQHFIRLLNNFVTGFQATLNLKYTIEEYTVRCKRFAISNFKENYLSVDHLLPIIVILFH